MTLALQLLTYNDSHYLPHVLDTLASQTDKDWELWTLDNSSDPVERERVKSILTQYSDRIVVHSQTSDSNTGFAGGHQALYEQHNADLILLVNVDVLLDNDYVEEIRKEMSEDAGLAAASGHLLRWYFDGDEIVRTDITDTLGLEKRSHEMVRDIGSGTVGSCTGDEVFGLSGCLPMYRRSAISQSTPGGRLFDPAYHLYKEDIDLAYYLHNAGWVARIVDRARAYHHRTFTSDSRSTIPNWVQRQAYRNHLWNLIKHLGWKDWIKRGIVIIPYEVSKAVYLGAKMPKDFWQAWRETIQNWKRLRNERSYVRR